jgi:alkylhydroperoxidase family enzyme
LHALIGKVATRPAKVTDADFAAAKASGFSEDQLFELVISAAVSQSARLYEAGPAALAAEDMREVLSAGVSRQQVEDALAVCAAFNTTDRLADAFGFELLSPEGFEAGAKYLLKRGYR